MCTLPSPIPPTVAAPSARTSTDPEGMASPIGTQPGAQTAALERDPGVTAPESAGARALEAALWLVLLTAMLNFTPALFTTKGLNEAPLWTKAVKDGPAL